MQAERQSQLSFFSQVPLDAYKQTLEETRFLKRVNNYAKKMARDTHFEEAEILNLLLLYYRIVARTKKTMTNAQIISILHNTFDMTDTEMTDKIIAALDKKTGGLKITKTVWLKMLSLFLRGDIEEKIDFCFSVYDSRKTGFLTREVLFENLRNAFFSTDGQTDEESTRDMIDILIKKLDLDRDGKISFNDYRQSVLRQPCLMEFLGQCLPDRMVCLKFLTTWKANIIVEQ